ncbi:MAG: SRPBCC family protein [Rhodospirillaceae bacterium]
MDVITDQDRFSVSLACPGAPETVWQVLTDPIHIVEWWGDYVTFTPGPGGGLVEEWQDADGVAKVTRAQIVEWAPPVGLDKPGRMVLDWADEDWTGSTRVSINLKAEAEGKRTRLSLEQRGWAGLGLDDGERDRLVAEHAAGWSVHFRDLRSLVMAKRP